MTRWPAVGDATTHLLDLVTGFLFSRFREQNPHHWG